MSCRMTKRFIYRSLTQACRGRLSLATAIGRIRTHCPQPWYRSRPRLRVAGRPRPSNRSGRRDAARTRRRGRLRYAGSVKMRPLRSSRPAAPLRCGRWVAPMGGFMAVGSISRGTLSVCGDLGFGFGRPAGRAAAAGRRHSRAPGGAEAGGWFPPTSSGGTAACPPAGFSLAGKSGRPRVRRRGQPQRAGPLVSVAG